MEIKGVSLHELDSAAKSILNNCAPNKIFLFDGNLGAGKTTLIKAMCHALGVDGEVTSPTYGLVNEYHGKNVVYHADLYRLNNLEEAYDIGFEEYLWSGNYCFIEWPELIIPMISASYSRIALSVDDENHRNILIKLFNMS